MSFVKDDHSYTRGVGAVAAMDAVSSKRRRAAARGATVMARRDAILSRHTLGRINQEPTDGGGGGVPTNTGGGTRPPVRPRLPAGITKLQLAQINKNVFVKTPGSVIIDPVRTPPALPTGPVVSPPPPKNTGIVPPLVGGASSPFNPTPRPPTYTPPDMSVEELPDVTIDTAPEPPAAKKSNGFLLYAAIGAGALYLLTRNK